MTRKNPRKRDLDPNMVCLVQALNAFDGIQTIGSCGGHPNPSPCQWDEGTFYLKFDVAWDNEGLFALEFLSWFINNYQGLSPEFSGKIRLFPTAPPPYLNDPGEGLSFVIEGHHHADPDELGRLLKDAKQKVFIPYEEEKGEAS